MQGGGESDAGSKGGAVGEVTGLGSFFRQRWRDRVESGAWTSSGAGAARSMALCSRVTTTRVTTPRSASRAPVVVRKTLIPSVTPSPSKSPNARGFGV